MKVTGTLEDRKAQVEAWKRELKLRREAGDNAGVQRLTRWIRTEQRAIREEASRG